MYNKRLRNQQLEDEQKRRELDAKKRRIFIMEIEKQLAEKDQAQKEMKDLEERDLENIRKKKDHDDNVYRDNMFRKKKEMQIYIDELTKQMLDDERKREEDLMNARMEKNTGLRMPDRREGKAMQRSKTHQLQTLSKS